MTIEHAANTFFPHIIGRGQLVLTLKEIFEKETPQERFERDFRRTQPITTNPKTPCSEK